MSEVLVGVDLGGTNVKAAVVSRDRKVLAKDSRPTQAEKGPEAVMDVMRDGVKAVLAEAGLDRSNVLAAGIESRTRRLNRTCHLRQ